MLSGTKVEEVDQGFVILDILTTMDLKVGQTVRLNASCIRVMDCAEHGIEVFFCDTNGIEFRGEPTGDGLRNLNGHEVVVKGKVPKQETLGDRMYDVENFIAEVTESNLVITFGALARFRERVDA